MTAQAFLEINEIENLKVFEKEFYDLHQPMSEKQIAFLLKYPHFGMKLNYKIMKDLSSQFQYDFLKIVDQNEEDLFKLPEKKLFAKIEDLRAKSDENLMITLKTLIQMYSKMDAIDPMGGENIAIEIFTPAFIKVFLQAELKGARSNINYIHSGDSDSINERYTELYKLYRKNGTQEGFDKYLKKEKLHPSGFLDTIFEFYERMLEYEDSLQFMEKINFGSLIQGLIKGAKQRNLDKLYLCVQEQLVLLVKRRIDQSKILQTLKDINIRFYLKDVEILKDKILKEVNSLCEDPKTIKIITDQLDYLLTRGDLLLDLIPSALKDILAKGDTELNDLLIIYQCFKGKSKESFLKVFAKCYKEVMLAKSGNMLQEFVNFESKIKELSKKKVYDNIDLLNILYETSANEVLAMNPQNPTEAINYIQKCWTSTAEKPSEELEKLLSPAMKYIDVIKDKDKLEINIRTFYFIQILSENSDLNKLKWLFNYLFNYFGNTLSKIKKLLREVSDGANICEEYKHTKHKASVVLVSNHSWPHLLFDMDLLKKVKIHPSLTNFNTEFETFYGDKFKHQKLMYLPLFGIVEVLDKSQGIARTINVNPLQASILMCYNDKDSLLISELEGLFCVDKKHINKCIAPFIPEILKLESDALSLCALGSGFASDINVSESSTNVFSDSKYYVSYASSEVFKESITSDKQVYEAFKMEEAHSSVIQSAIVRILKEKLVYDYTNLKKDVYQRLASKFTVIEEEFDASLKKLEQKGLCSSKGDGFYEYTD
ncbi:unnamed protein product [Moneuplotes crassus]|uniref:Cullin family profile domain-containing protein n=1 Tax=Euplotes crassus TaxID=5936 RepID=A0AAD1YAH3_EUPCR|nr:unnamed protein product [Moneuplotes crassus]